MSKEPICVTGTFEEAQALADLLGYSIINGPFDTHADCQEWCIGTGTAASEVPPTGGTCGGCVQQPFYNARIPSTTAGCAGCSDLASTFTLSGFPVADLVSTSMRVASITPTCLWLGPRDSSGQPTQIVCRSAGIQYGIALGFYQNIGGANYWIMGAYSGKNTAADPWVFRPMAFVGEGGFVCDGITEFWGSWLSHTDVCNFGNYAEVWH